MLDHVLANIFTSLFNDSVTFSACVIAELFHEIVKFLYGSNGRMYLANRTLGHLPVRYVMLG